MKFTKPAWVSHKDPSSKGDQAPKRLSIFSVHVHPDGSRIATGGLDAKVRIWSTKPILNSASELSNRPPKSLCTLTMHTGPVLCVRWAHSGRWLASGSDDEIVMIWDLDPSAKGKVWGTDEVNVEGWKPLKRLPGHESDVTDVAWSPNDRYLASVGLDSKVLIWCGYTLERLQKLDLHQGFVKGVCWDPVGEFLATQSDDKTVKIWRTEDWSLEAEVRKPFEDSPGSTFFRRLSWSPDGAHITASNATNNQGFVFIAAVITRGSWTSEISLVGHENTVEVASYNPHIFLRDPSQPVHTSNICSVVALGADDRSVSVWQTKSARPLIVAKEVFERQIMDLAWSWDGLALYAVSSDGTLAAFSFDPDELEGLAPHTVQQQYLSRFNYLSPPLPSGYSHTSTPMPVQSQTPARSQTPGIRMSDDRERMTPPPSPSRGETPALAQPHANGFDGVNGNGGGERINKLVAKRKPKGTKRVQPTFMGSLGGAGPSNAAAVPSASMEGSKPGSSAHGYGRPQGPYSNQGGALVGPGMGMGIGTGMESSPFAPEFSRRLSDHGHGQGQSYRSRSREEEYGDYSSASLGMDLDVPISSLGLNDPAPGGSVSGGKRKAEYVGDERPGKARTLGGDRVREAVVVRKISGLGGPGAGIAAGGVGAGAVVGQKVFEVLPVVTYLSVKGEGMSDDVFEGKNAESGAVNEVAYVSGKQTQWLDFLPSPSIVLAASNTFAAVAMLDGCLNVYSLTGRRMMPTLTLDSPANFLAAAKNALIAVTSNGTLYSWNVKKSTAHFAPTSVVPILSLSPNASTSGIPSHMTSLSARPNGAPIIHTTSGTAYSYDSSLLTFVKLSEPWWSQGSDAWSGRQRTSTTASAQTSKTGTNVVAGVESVVAETMKTSGSNGTGGGSEFGYGDGAAGVQRPEWWSTALTLGHLETKMHAGKVLEGSPAEFKQFLLVYAKKISDEGFRGKAEELIKELFGPVYWRPGMGGTSGGKEGEGWNPVMCGMQKRDLLRDVLAIFARSKTLTKLAMDWQDLLRKAAAAGDD